MTTKKIKIEEMSEYFINLLKNWEIQIGKQAKKEEREKKREQVRWLKEKLVEEGIHQRKPISVITFNEILDQAFPDLIDKKHLEVEK